MKTRKEFIKEKTISPLTKEDAKTLLNYCGGDIGRLAFILWNKGKVKSKESGIQMAKKIKNFANEK